MSATDAGIDDLYGPFLQRFAGGCVRVADHLEARLMAAEDAGECARLAEVWAKVGRGLRQTLALHSKLKGDDERLAREREMHDNAHRAQRELQRREAVARRREALRIRLERVAWDEVPDPDWHDDFQGDLHDELNEEARLATFLDEPEDAQFERLWRQLGLGPSPEREDEDATEAAADPSSDPEPPAETDDEPHEPFVRTPGKYKPDSS